MLLPTGSTLPPLPYLVGLAAALLVVSAWLYRRDVALQTRTVLALAPWMVLGSALYVCYQIGAAPAALAPLCSSPTVYASTAVLAGLVWALASRFEATDRWLAGTGVVLSLFPIGVAIAVALDAESFSPGWSILGAVLAGLLALLIWYVLGQYQPETTAILGPAGGVAVFAHVLDGISTTIGIDVLQFGEQTPLSAALIELGAALPTAPYIGTGWVFALVKIALGVAVVWFIADLVRDDPPLGNGLLLVITAVGLGPATHNLILFAVAGPAGV
ncbi:hypothetical protein HTSR_1865 [Halodesulfurarchaeum formicicum]|uniref:DUF63 domain-containing protein n=1 Tax=Halodesulfurarchaeum formicicum TaxID=1873524 RepID=A0A1D8S6P5_9EURY|nr:DUF63 family protein [Halodesulfurarchaeum formicicum]AOW81030.1 hypothetical protein HTSR_1865 [Halodesulfurarchaeum formicicum]APE96366.1 hypothetical protein HSR6_1934 [Halodesulfurarchaeum formicicum]